jgi:hypothetical protein
MGIAYRTDGPGGVSVSVWVDKVTRKRALQHVVDLAAEPDWGASGRILTDLSYVSSRSIPTPDQVLKMAYLFEEQIGGRTRSARWAVMANQAFDEATRFGDEIRTARMTPHREERAAFLRRFLQRPSRPWADPANSADGQSVGEVKKPAKALTAPLRIVYELLLSERSVRAQC